MVGGAFVGDGFVFLAETRLGIDLRELVRRDPSFSLRRPPWTTKSNPFNDMCGFQVPQTTPTSPLRKNLATPTRFSVEK